MKYEKKNVLDNARATNLGATNDIWRRNNLWQFVLIPDYYSYIQSI